MFCLLLVQATFLLGNESKTGLGEKIAPLITDTTFAIAYVDIDQINVDEFFQKNFSDIDKAVKIFGFDSTSVKRITAEFSRLLEKMKTEFKSQIGKLKDATMIRNAYFFINVGELNKVKSSIKLSFVFAIPTDKNSEKYRKKMRVVVDSLGSNVDASLEMSWAIGQYGGFDVVVTEIDWNLPGRTSEHLTPVVVPEKDEISPHDELVDGRELAAREKNWISNFFSRPNKEIAELIKEPFDKHEKDAPIRLVCVNIKNILPVFDYLFVSLMPKESSEPPIKTGFEQLFNKAKVYMNVFKNTKWLSIVINPKSMMLEVIVQMRNKSEAKELLACYIDLNDMYCDAIVAEQIRETMKTDSKFQPLLSQMLKGFNRIDNPVQNGDRLELMQRDCESHKLVCAEYCIIAYILLVLINR
ncbi:MAG: hypothetical protein LBC74_10375 [Planctomycetaceae bacterium]|nr:hypothetical protein [Planctomycetaceae bacterium]